MGGERKREKGGGRKGGREEGKERERERKVEGYSIYLSINICPFIYHLSVLRTGCSWVFALLFAVWKAFFPFFSRKDVAGYSPDVFSVGSVNTSLTRVPTHSLFFTFVQICYRTYHSPSCLCVCLSGEILGDLNEDTMSLSQLSWGHRDNLVRRAQCPKLENKEEGAILRNTLMGAIPKTG